MERTRLLPRIDGRAGYTLVEILVATLLTSIMVTSVFGVALSAKRGGGKSDRRLVAAQVAKRMSSQLRNFVTGCDCDASSGACAASPSTKPCDVILGPTPRGDVASWYLNDPNNSDLNARVFDDRGDVWALAAGVHNVTGAGVIPPELSACGGSVRYTVDNSLVVNGRPVPQVKLEVLWTEP